MEAETELMRRVQRGEEGALRELYDRLAGNVHALALRMLHDRGDAEEVVQDTFVAVYDHAARFEPGRGSVRAWVYTIARNEALMRLRRRRSRPARDADLDPHEPGSPLAAPPGGAGHVERIAVERCLARLEPDEAELLVGAFFDGYSHRELAERSGAPLGSVKSRIRRALLKLRAFLEEA